MSRRGGASFPWRKHGSFPGNTRPAAMPSIPMISTGLTFIAFCILNIISWQLPKEVCICATRSEASCGHMLAT
eukprot:Skav221614  [mRNA]  locus=scaffold1327:94956:95507:+ [translate_table: standard]